MLYFLLGLCLLCLSSQADDRVRVEKRDCVQFEFATAMNTVTEFYCHSQEKGVSLFLFNPPVLGESSSVFGPDTRSQWDACLKFSLHPKVKPVFHGCLLLSVKTPCSCFVPPPPLPPGCRSLSSVASLESPVICCLGPLIQYLREFNLERVLRSERYIAQRKSPQLKFKGDIMQGFSLLARQRDDNGGGD